MGWATPTERKKVRIYNIVMTFELSMRSGATRFTIGLLGLIVFGLITLRAEKSFFAEKLSKIPLFGTEFAIQAEPDDAGYEFELGNYWLIAAQQAETALPHFERATTLDPYNGRYWGQLALASQQAGDVDRARYALEQALRVDPTTPELLWEAANVYSVLQDKEKSLDALRRFVRSSPEQAPIAAQLGWRTTRDVRTLLDGVLPKGPASDVSLLIVLARSADPTASARIEVWDDPKDMFVHNLVQLGAPEAKINMPKEPTLDLAAEKEKARNKMLRLIDAKSGRDWSQTVSQIAAREQQHQNASYQEKQERKRHDREEKSDLYNAGDLVWKRLMAETEKFDIHFALPYIQMLIDADQEDASIKAWDMLVAREAYLKDWTQRDNLVRNSGFEREILNGGFDWQYTFSQDEALAVDHRTAKEGVSSLLVTFKDKPVADAGIVQYVPVRPNTRYEFTGYLKADSLITATGPRLLVQDIDADAPYFESQDVRGTMNWTKVAGRFTTSLSAHFVEIKLIRDPGATLVKGQVWADAISLVPVQGN